MALKIRDEKHLLAVCRRVSRLNDQLVLARRQKLSDSTTGVLVQVYEVEELERQRQQLLDCINEYDQKHNLDRSGEWFVSASGRRFWPLDPRPEDIDIKDIAWALSFICRFCGHTRGFYSVAQHSVLVSHVVHPRAALAGLLHDASEAYLGDVIRPIKKLLPFYVSVEDRVMEAVCQRFGLDAHDEKLWAEVKRGDNVLLSTEFRDLARCGVRLSIPEEPPMPERIRRWSAARSRREFLARFEVLRGQQAV